jgi:hypothetical protein
MVAARGETIAQFECAALRLEKRRLREMDEINDIDGRHAGPSSLLLEHDLFRKPVSAFRDHAPGWRCDFRLSRVEAAEIQFPIRQLAGEIPAESQR